MPTLYIIAGCNGAGKTTTTFSLSPDAELKIVTLNYTIKLRKMGIEQKREDLSDKIQIALDKGIKKLIAETKATNSYLVVADKDGKVKKIPAKDL